MNAGSPGTLRAVAATLAVRRFLAGRGIQETDGQLPLTSLDYVVLLFELEEDLSMQINDELFFQDGAPTTFQSLIRSVLQATGTL